MKQKMKKLQVPLLIILAGLIISCESGEKEKKEEIFFADPTIYAENGQYYLTGTGGGRPAGTGGARLTGTGGRQPSGFRVLVSDDLENWKSPTDSSDHFILESGKEAYGTRGFWAPQILKEDGKYYLTYTANEQTCIASSNSLMGPFTQATVEPIDSSEKNIDSYLFRDEDGKNYLYHVRFNRGNYLWVGEFNLETGKINANTLKQCFGNTQDWEATPNYESNPIMEGPTVIKMEDTYYLFYSANHFRNIDYAVGYATSDSPLVPWEKYEKNPIIHRSMVGENGSGHGDIFKGKGNEFYYVFHVHNSDTVISPRRTRIVPLQSEWNEKTSKYDFSIDENEIIKPLRID